MSLFALGLVVSSTFMHAGWNLLAKSGGSEQYFFQRALRLTILAVAVPLVVMEVVGKPFPIVAYICVAGSGVFAGGYFWGLARAYGSGDFTVVYPIVRALPVILLGLVDAFRGRLPTSLGWLGIGFVAGGCLLAPLHSLREIRLANYRLESGFWILMTALATVGYTLLDKLAAEMVPPGPLTALRYGCWFMVTTALAYELILSRWSGDRKESESGSLWRAGLAAGCHFGAYSLILWAYQLAERVSYVVAFRQFSIVIGVVVAVMIGNEPGRAVRTLAAGVICTGLVMIGLWG